MNYIIVIILGAVCGAAHFLIMRYKLKPLAEGKGLKTGRMLLLQYPVPLIFFLGCAFFDPALLPYAGGAFCLSLAAAGAVNYFTAMRKKG